MSAIAPETLAALRDAATARFRAGPLDRDDQSRIALLIQAIKSANALILAKVEAQNLDWWVYRFLHDQFFSEAELASLLARTARWTFNPAVYLEATDLNALLWRRAGIARYLMAPFGPTKAFFEYLALSHAFMAEIRFIRLFPTDWDLTEPFLHALNAIEEENGRQIQVQIRLLKEFDAPEITPLARERIVDRQRDIVVEIFARFLQRLVTAERRP
jgi:hypothetical protein